MTCKNVLGTVNCLLQLFLLLHRWNQTISINVSAAGEQVFLSQCCVFKTSYGSVQLSDGRLFLSVLKAAECCCFNHIH